MKKGVLARRKSDVEEKKRDKCRLKKIIIQNFEGNDRIDKI